MDAHDVAMDLHSAMRDWAIDFDDFDMTALNGNQDLASFGITLDGRPFHIIVQGL